jgi:diguanylate cyclase (GGDEF)-like protein
MLEGHFFNPAIQGSVPALVQLFGTVLFSAVFLYLWRQSGVVYFGFWSLAWVVESLALTSSFVANSSGLAVFLWLRALLEFFFALSVLIAARSAAGATARGFQTSLRSLLWLPGTLLVVLCVGWLLPLPQFRAVHAASLAVVYAYSFVSIGAGGSGNRGMGEKLLRFTLACLFLEYLGHAALSFNWVLVGVGSLMLPLRWFDIYDLAPQMLLVFSALAMWIETQDDALGQLRGEIVTLEKNVVGSSELDHLTGLLNRVAFDRHLDETFSGVVAVCDLDYFKDINDRFGHLVGDDVLRGVGNLIRASIRAEDDAFRWGGDEFVIVFRHQHLDLVRGRMAVLEERLQSFRIRGHGAFPLGLSWGAAEGDNRLLRPVVEEADLQMYERKREAHARNEGLLH